MRRETGFTLVELIITVVVIGIVAAIAVPAWMEFVRRNRVATTANRLVAALHYARGKAVQSSNGVSLCASSDGSTCTGATDWSVGWLVYEDANDDGDPDTGEVLRIWDGVADTLTLTGSSSQLTYQPTGTLTNVASFDLEPASCPADSKLHVNIDLNISGQPITTRAAC